MGLNAIGPKASTPAVLEPVQAAKPAVPQTVATATPIPQTEMETTPC